MRPPRPAGFTFLTVCAVLCACAMAWALALVGDGEDVSLPFRLALGTATILLMPILIALSIVWNGLHPSPVLAPGRRRPGAP